MLTYLSKAILKPLPLLLRKNHFFLSPFIPLRSAFSSQKVHRTSSIENKAKTLYCEGCNSILQSQDNKKYGYIEENKLKEVVQSNKIKMGEVYAPKIDKKDSKTIQFLREVEKQSGITIFNPKSPHLQNLDDLQVLVRLDEKMSKYEQTEQLAKKTPKVREKIFCYRCHCLRYHNRLPEEYDHDFTEDKAEFLMRKVLNKHKENIEYFYVVDVFDMLGTFQDWIFQKLLAQNVKFSIVVSKIDIINDKYLNETMVHACIRDKVKRLLIKNNIGDREINFFFTSSVSREGIKKMQKYLKDTETNIQLIGYPNTGKTTLLNILAKLQKSTSRIPGTTVKITEHAYSGKRRIYDMPGLHCDYLLYNMIDKPSRRSLLTWHKKYSPGILTHSAFIYGGKIQIEGVRIIVFGLGGACSSTNRWFLTNLKQFWKGLPPLSQLQIEKHEIELEFRNGKSEDLEIAGYGFIGFRLCQEKVKYARKKLTIYLPKKVKFGFRSSILTSDDKVFHNRSGMVKRFMLERLYLQREGK